MNLSEAARMVSRGETPPRAWLDLLCAAGYARRNVRTFEMAMIVKRTGLYPVFLTDRGKAAAR